MGVSRVRLGTALPLQASGCPHVVSHVHPALSHGAVLLWWLWPVPRVHQLTLPYVLNVCVQLTSGLRHLHAACGVLHRDLKTDNALVAGKDPLVVKWADFGCSVKLAGGAASAGVARNYGNCESGRGVPHHGFGPLGCLLSPSFSLITHYCEYCLCRQPSSTRSCWRRRRGVPVRRSSPDPAVTWWRQKRVTCSCWAAPSSRC